MTSTPASDPLHGPTPRSEAETSGSTPESSEAVSEAHSASREPSGIEALIEQSSLGTPEAAALRAETPPAVALAIVLASRYLRRAEAAEAELEIQSHARIEATNRAGVAEARVAELEATLAARDARFAREAKAEALREFADSRGVNVGDEDDAWWRGYRQAQREALQDATTAASLATARAEAGDDDE